MGWESLSKLLGLCASALAAFVTIWLLTRHERRPRPPAALREGYPPGDFPRRDLVEADPLASLCQSQRRLLSLYRELPASSHASGTVLVFLEELRGVMDGAYALACTQASPRRTLRLAQLVEQVHGAVGEMTERARRQLGESSDGGLEGDLEVRLDVLRALARDVDD